MGLFWDLFQQSQLQEQGSRAGNLEARQARLEADLAQSRQMWSRRCDAWRGDSAEPSIATAGSAERQRLT